MRVGQLVADDEQGRLALFLRGVQHIIDRGIVMGGDGSHNALMRARGAHVVELAAVDAHDDGAALLCHGGKAAKRTVRVAVGQKYLVDGAAAAQRLGDGVAALDHILRQRFLRGLARLFRLFGIFFHGCLCFPAHDTPFAISLPWEALNQSSAADAGAFSSIHRYEKLEILRSRWRLCRLTDAACPLRVHKVFLRFPYLALPKNLSTSTLAD